MIELAAARNILDLLEIYVSGAIWLTHYDSNHFGMRGLVVYRDYKTLLLINGHIMNQRAINGMTTELENLDMNDIDTIEIVRGQGFNMVTTRVFFINWDMGLSLEGSGNNLRSYPRNITKFYHIWNLNEKLSILNSFRFLYDYQGDKNLISMYEKSAISPDADLQTTEQIKINAAKARKDLLKTNISWDISFTLHISDKADLSIFATNILGDYKRYQYANISILAIDEPRVLGAKLNIEY